MAKEAKVGTKVQGVKGGNPSYKENVGYVTTLIGSARASITVDAFSGYDETYIRRKEELINITDGSGNTIFSGTFKELESVLLAGSETLENERNALAAAPVSGTRVWSEIRNSHLDEEQKTLYIDGYLTEDENEDGRVIATINIETSEVTYEDYRAKTDPYAQEVIIESIELIKQGNY